MWRRGSVVASWLLDLTASALCTAPDLAEFRGPRLRFGRGPLDGDGRRSTRACRPGHQHRAVPAFRVPGSGDFADKLLSAMRSEFGGHAEKK